MAHLGRNARIRASHEHLYLSLCLLGNYGPQQAQLFMCVTVGNCCNTGITVRKFSVRSYERYLFAKSLSKLILCTHTRSAVELILWHSDTWIYLIPQFRESLARIPWAWHKGMGVLLPCPHYKALTRDNKVFSGQICHFLQEASAGTFYLRILFTLLCTNDRPECCPLPVFLCFQHVCFPGRITGKARDVWHCGLGAILLGSGSWVFCWQVICVVAVFECRSLALT